jgi:phospholipid transport system substrate-binding protein
MMAATAVFAVPGVAHALDDVTARALIDKAVGDVNRVINSGKPIDAMLAEFEGIFTAYADVPIIAQSALGIAARSATPAQMAAFTLAFRGYISRKYGRRFREFIGGRIEVVSSRQLKSFYEVRSIAYLQSQAPFEVLWHVSDGSGKDLFFNIIIEGINMLAAERTEIGAMLDRRRGDINALINDLKTAG